MPANRLPSRTASSPPSGTNTSTSFPEDPDLVAPPTAPGGTTSPVQTEKGATGVLGLGSDIVKLSRKSLTGIHGGEQLAGAVGESGRSRRSATAVLAAPVDTASKASRKTATGTLGGKLKKAPPGRVKGPRNTPTSTKTAPKKKAAKKPNRRTAAAAPATHRRGKASTSSRKGARTKTRRRTARDR